ncbi:MAG: hypothetical protein JEZ11_17730 [Desulfobacterales bacterium]|nr:hypothetical protein [Desulfobacterales bacterium]
MAGLKLVNRGRAKQNAFIPTGYLKSKGFKTFPPPADAQEREGRKEKGEIGGGPSRMALYQWVISKKGRFFELYTYFGGQKGQFNGHPAGLQ